MAETDGWTGLAERFEADLLEDFAAFVEQIELALQLLQDGARSRLRTGLVELDCLADILLYRRAKLVERASDGSSHHNHALTLTYPERKQLEGNFADRVTQATEAISGAWFISLTAMLTQAEADVFRIAHAYRNRAYHRGELNAAALPTITRIFLVALTQAWSRAQPSIGIEARRWARRRPARLARVAPDGGYVCLHRAAEELAEELIAEAAVEASEVRVALAEDLLLRVEGAHALLADLTRDGLDRGQVTEQLAWGEMGEAFERDRDTVADLRERRSLARQLVAAGDEWPDDLYAAYVEVQERHASRFFAAKAAHRPKLSLQVLDRLPARIAAMRRLKDPAAVLNRYRELDMQLEPLERQLWSIARGWDEYLEHETQRLRGN